MHSSPAIGQQTVKPDRPRIGLVLSGGSAKGLAHVGVLKVLEAEGIPIDVVSGTSMGAIVGGLYAIGYSPEQLAEFATTVDWDELFSNKSLRRSQLLEVRNANRGILVSLPFQGTEIKLPSGILFGQNASMMLSRLTWPYQDVTDFTKLPIPFACVATNLRTGQATALSGIPLPEAIRTSLSLPSVFAPVSINGDLFIDGGLSRNVPAIDALEIGAEYLIGVDVGAAVDSVSSRDPSFLDVMFESSLFHSARQDAEQRQLLDVLIQPDIANLSRASFAASAEWIRRGEDAARQALPKIHALLDSLGIGRVDAYRTDSLRIDAVAIDSVHIDGISGDVLALVEARLNLDIPSLFGPDEIGHAIERVYGTNLFDQVTYVVSRPDSIYGRRTLRIVVQPQQVPNRVGFGLRYDSYYKAELLFNMAVKNRRRLGSSSEFRLRLGEQLEAEGSHFVRLGRRSRFSVGGSFGYSSAPVNVFVPGTYLDSIGADPNIPVLTLRIDSFRGRLFTGFASSESVFAGFYGKAEHLRIRRVVAGRIAVSPDSITTTAIARVVDSNQDLVAGGVVWQMDTLDRLDFPRRGVHISVEGELGLSNAVPQLALVPREANDLLEVGLYRRGIARTEWHAPVSDVLSLFGNLVVAYGSGDALPTSYYAFLGGVNTVTVTAGTFIPAYGLRTQQRFGRKAYLGLLGVQLELRNDMVVRFIANVGDTFDLFGGDDKNELDPDLYDLLREPAFVGFGAELGLRTRLGPLRLILDGGEERQRPNLSIRFGFEF